MENKRDEFWDFKDGWIENEPKYLQMVDVAKGAIKGAFGKWSKFEKFCAIVTVLFFLFLIVPKASAANEVPETPQTPQSTETVAETPPVTPRGQIGQEPEWLTPLIYASSDKYGVPAGVISALIRLESASTFDPNIQGDFIDGQYRSFGLGQIYIELHGVTVEQATNPEFAVDWIAQHLKGKYDRWGTWYQALQAYNGGDGAIYGSYSHGYADRICREAGLY